jgi:hypothetical protein
MISYILLFSLLSTVWAKPVDRLVPKTIAAPVAAETGTPKRPVDFGTPIEGSSFFSITSSCFSDKRVGKGYNTRADFYKTAYKDAVEIADAATKWPQLGTDASDLYFGKNTEDSRYAKNIIGMLTNGPTPIYTDVSILQRESQCCRRLGPSEVGV